MDSGDLGHVHGVRRCEATCGEYLPYGQWNGARGCVVWGRQNTHLVAQSRARARRQCRARTARRARTSAVRDHADARRRRMDVDVPAPSSDPTPAPPPTEPPPPQPDGRLPTETRSGTSSAPSVRRRTALCATSSTVSTTFSSSSSRTLCRSRLGGQGAPLLVTAFEEHRVTLCNVSVQRPSATDADGVDRDLLPHMARLRGLTYASAVLVDVVHDVYVGDAHAERRVFREVNGGAACPSCSAATRATRSTARTRASAGSTRAATAARLGVREGAHRHGEAPPQRAVRLQRASTVALRAAVRAARRQRCASCAPPRRRRGRPTRKRGRRCEMVATQRGDMSP